MEEGDQLEGERPDGGHIPKPPAYSQGDLINSIKALDISTWDELIDQIMDDLGF